MKTSSNSQSISIGTESSSTNDKQSGGGLFGIFGNNCETDALLDALTSENIEAAFFILDKARRENKRIDYTATNKYNIPLIHLLMAYSLYSPSIRNAIKQIIPEIKPIISIQDSEGNTLAHYALQLGLVDMVRLLSDNGIDLSIKNSKGYRIVKDNDTIDIPDGSEKIIHNEPVSVSMDNVFKTITKKKEKKNPMTTSDSDLSFTRSVTSTTTTSIPSESLDTDQFVKKLIDKINEPPPSSKITQDTKKKLLDQIENIKSSSEDKPKEITSTEFIENFKTKSNLNNSHPVENIDLLVSPSPISQEPAKLSDVLSVTSSDNKSILNDDKFSATSSVKNVNLLTSPSHINPEPAKLSDVLSVTSSDNKSILNDDKISATSPVISSDDIFKKVSKGGKKNKKNPASTDIASSFTFDMNVSTSSSIGGSNKKNSSSDSDIKKISRSIINKTSEIHQRVVQKIMEIMSIDEIKAKAYKSLIYYKVKEEHPELNSYDRAVEMEKMATKDTLDTLDISERVKIIEEKTKQRSESPKFKSSSPESPTSDEKPIKKVKKGSKEKKPKKKSKNTTESSSDGILNLNSSDSN
jgi:hypothetical protein